MSHGWCPWRKPLTTGLVLVFLLPGWPRRPGGGATAAVGTGARSAEPDLELGRVGPRHPDLPWPVLAIRRLHAGPALALALGAGVRCRRWVAADASWQRGACWAGASRP